ncbi:MAG: cation diffusion facilitator family transporter [Synergistales bacterium]|nr:cation diffusion facilitator family transporter [Synergistales bacterium]
METQPSSNLGQPRQSPEERAARAGTVLWIGLLGNVSLSVLKFIVGTMGHSAAVVADAVNSLSDAVTDLVMALGFRVVAKPADNNHPYGHGKVETLLALLSGMVLLGAGGGILYDAARRLLQALDGIYPSVPGGIALWGAGISVVVKEGLFRYTHRLGRALDSRALLAKAWDNRTDVLSSAGTFIGVGAAVVLGHRWVLLDPAAALIISILIIKEALPIIRDSLRELTDASLDETTEQAICSCISDVPGVQGCHRLRTRRVGPTIAMDVHIHVARDLSIVAAHDIATEVERVLQRQFGDTILTSIHAEPTPPASPLRD